MEANHVGLTPQFRDNKYYCGLCGKRFYFKLKPKYCHKCGARINWGKTRKEQCDIDYKNKQLELSDTKCTECKYYFTCPYMKMAMDEVLYGD